MNISNNGINLIKKVEGLKLKPYLCSAGVPTIGFGSTVYPNGIKVTMKDKEITELQAIEIFRNTIKSYENAVNTFIKSKINQNQFDALVCFCYNIGVGAFGKSTVVSRVNNNPNDKTIKDAFLMWVKANSVILNGLVNRRMAEIELYYK